MKALMLTLALVAATPAGAADLLRCKALNSAALDDFGRISHESGSAIAGFFSYDDFTVDLDTGMIRSPLPKEWVVIQEGNGGMDTVLVPNVHLPAAATFSLRIRKWAKKETTTFLAFELSTLTSGT